MHQLPISLDAPVPAYNSATTNSFPAAPFGARLAGLALAAVFTLGTLTGIAGLASVDSHAQATQPQMVEQVQAQKAA